MVTMADRAKWILCEHDGPGGFGVHWREDLVPCGAVLSSLGHWTGTQLRDGAEHVGLG